MKQFKPLRYFPILIAITLIGHFCSKPSSGGISRTGTTGSTNTDSNANVFGLQIIHNPAFAGANDTLQAVYTASGSPYKTYYFGSYNASGAPDSIKSLAIKNQKGDTTASFTLDDSLRVRSMYMTYGSNRDTTLISFGYETPGQTTVRIFNYDVATKGTILRYVYTVNNLAKTMISSKQYSFFGEGLIDFMLLQVSVSGPPDPVFSQFLVVQGSMGGIVNVVSIGVTYGICLLEPPLCIAAAIAEAIIIASPASAATSDTDSPPSDDAPAPDVPSDPAFEVGDYHEDGSMVVSVDQTQVHGLVVSSADQSAGVTWPDAESIASSYGSGGNTDWRLPTSQELFTLYYYCDLVGNFSTDCNNNNFRNCSYWSSTANGSLYIWVCYFDNGVFWSNYTPNSIARLRLVRSF